MPEVKIKSPFTYKNCTNLILYIFYLQYLVGRVLDYIWQSIFLSEVPELVALLSTQIFAVIIPCAIFFIYNSLTPNEIIEHTPLNKQSIILCFVIGIFAQPVASLLNTPAVLLSQKTSEAVVSTPANFSHLLISLFAIALIPAIFEEILLRGIIFHSLKKQGYRLTLIVTSLIFAILHNSTQNFVGMFFLGLILCFVTWMTESIYSAMIVHFSFNACGLIADYIITNTVALHPWVVSNILSIIIIILSTIILSIAISRINKKYIRKYKTKNLLLKVVLSILNIPMLLVVAGYFMFNFGH